MQEEPIVVMPIGGEPLVLGAEMVRLRWVDGPACGRRGYVLELDGKPLKGVRRVDVIGRAGDLCNVRIELAAVALDLDLNAQLDGQVIGLGGKRYRLVEED